MTVAELVDRGTILVLKQKHGLDVGTELAAVHGALEGKDIIPDWFLLLAANKAIWEYQDAVVAGKENDAHHLIKLNNVRASLKRAIALRFNEYADNKVF